MPPPAISNSGYPLHSEGNYINEMILIAVITSFDKFL
jgi:hypothetical protein